MTFVSAGVEIIEALKEAMSSAAGQIMVDASYLIPKDTLTAVQSGRAGSIESTTDSYYVEFGFGYGGGINPKTGKPIEDYIVPLHEILEVHHDPPTQAKFLEEPLLARVATLEVEYSEKIKAHMSATYGD